MIGRDGRKGGRKCGCGSGTRPITENSYLFGAGSGGDGYWSWGKGELETGRRRHDGNGQSSVDSFTACASTGRGRLSVQMVGKAMKVLRKWEEGQKQKM
jgi:hypothetical protein